MHVAGVLGAYGASFLDVCFVSAGCVVERRRCLFICGEGVVWGRYGGK